MSASCFEQGYFDSQLQRIRQVPLPLLFSLLTATGFAAEPEKGLVAGADCRGHAGCSQVADMTPRADDLAGALGAGRGPTFPADLFLERPRLLCGNAFFRPALGLRFAHQPGIHRIP